MIDNKKKIRVIMLTNKGVLFFILKIYMADYSTSAGGSAFDSNIRIHFIQQ